MNVATRRERIEQWVLPLGAALLAVAAWELAVRGTGTKVFPSPAEVARALAGLLRGGHLFPYVRDSLLRVGAGYGLALVVGVPLGLAMGWNRSVASAMNPVVQVLRPISPLAWIPVAIVLFGVSNAATFFLIFLGAVFPIAVATASGVATVPAMYRRAAHNFGLSTRATLARVVLPAALPQVLSGLRVGLGVAWVVVVAAEMIAVDSGLGYLITDARNAGKRYDLVVAGMLLIGTIGLALDSLFRRVETLRAVRWGFERS